MWGNESHRSPEWWFCSNSASFWWSACWIYRFTFTSITYRNIHADLRGLVLDHWRDNKLQPCPSNHFISACALPHLHRTYNNRAGQRSGCHSPINPRLAVLHLQPFFQFRLFGLHQRADNLHGDYWWVRGNISRAEEAHWWSSLNRSFRPHPAAPQRRRILAS